MNTPIKTDGFFFGKETDFFQNMANLIGGIFLLSRLGAVRCMSVDILANWQTSFTFKLTSGSIDLRDQVTTKKCTKGVLWSKNTTISFLLSFAINKKHLTLKKASENCDDRWPLGPDIPCAISDIPLPWTVPNDDPFKSTWMPSHTSAEFSQHDAEKTLDLFKEKPILKTQAPYWKTKQHDNQKKITTVRKGPVV